MPSILGAGRPPGATFISDLRHSAPITDIRRMETLCLSIPLSSCRANPSHGSQPHPVPSAKSNPNANNLVTSPRYTMTAIHPQLLDKDFTNRNTSKRQLSSSPMTYPHKSQRKRGERYVNDGNDSNVPRFVRRYGSYCGV